jgi:hypothetical protein
VKGEPPTTKLAIRLVNSAFRQIGVIVWLYADRPSTQHRVSLSPPEHQFDESAAAMPISGARIPRHLGYAVDPTVGGRSALKFQPCIEVKRG